jgi:hypothetical protein
VATASSSALVDQIFWRGVQLATVVLVGWVPAFIMARLIAARLAGRRHGGR